MEKGVFPFWEYEYVKKHTQDLELLERLYNIRLSAKETLRMMEYLAKENGITVPLVKWTNRTDRGWYDHSGFIRLRPSYISAELAMHELTHHWTFVKCGPNVPAHGWDFLMRLDKLAQSARSYFIGP